ncbi:MAG: bifunctional 5,10-methylenetetrahydrofolate dehydrogenase/5,10-methenyltetrahydrofolate cyclohydrolase [Nitrospirae bacterium]|nr:MAG: bifunctional 5,10-methylenetetrahydrofolate dehydrogenase/5,10-methenyltetrahydrofolate cyclohydrolase [Nitrospirota bacterium]
MKGILDGKKLAEEIKADVKKDVAALNKIGIDVGIALLLVGDNPASIQYFKTTVGTCRQVGITVYEHRLPDTASLNEILNVVHAINADERMSGLLLLMPLPMRINARRVINSIVSEKDVDGLGAISVGRLAADESTFQLFKMVDGDTPQNINLLPSMRSFLPCTPYGVIRLLEHHNIPIKGKHAVIIGKSLAVGKPLSLMFLAKEATVTVCHRETQDLASFTKQADILCSATGRAGLIKGDMVKDGAVVVDIGINMLKDGTITGDVDFASVSKKASITPVPGGVGPVTIAMLLENTVRSAQRNEMIKSPLTIV